MTTTYARPPEKWPLLLCGPMLRRVTRTSVCVFLTLKAPYRVRLKLFNTPELSATPVASTEATLLPLGPLLHVGAVELKLTEPLSTGVPYYYDLDFIPPPGVNAQVQDLAAMGLLASGEISYEGQRPSFVLAPSLAQFNLVHGSCRRPAAEGSDVLALVDRQLAQSFSQSFSQRDVRPHQLVLTGDQIYADDVDLSLAMTLRDTARLLVGDHERLDQPDLHSRLGDDRFMPGPKRGKFVAEQTGYTTTDNQGHLLFLGEYFAMYLMAFSDALWPRALNPADPTQELQPSRFHLGYPLPEDASCSDRNALRASRRRTLQFAASLRMARRVFANVPTSMIFDDHEVSDDWNCNREWRDGVRNRPLGRRLLRNALVSYALFQDWGNHPEQYQPGARGEALLQAVRAPAASGPASGVPAIHETPEVLEELLDIRGPLPGQQEPQTTPRAQRLHWDYTLDGQDYRIIVLDTRTYRHFPEREQVLPHVAYDTEQERLELREVHFRKVPPGLMSSEAIQAQLAAHRDPSRFHIVVSPPPVIAVPAVEVLLNSVAAIKPSTGPEKTDREAWAGHTPTHHALLRELARLGPSTVVLSGDVHHSFTFSLSYYDTANDSPPEAPEAQKRARIVQLCSSALKNHSYQTMVAALMDDRPWKIAGIISQSDSAQKARALYVALSNAVARAREQGNLPDLSHVREAMCTLPALNMAGQLDSLPIELHTHLLLENPLFAEPARLFAQFGSDRRYTVQSMHQPYSAGGPEPGPFGINRWAHTKIIGVSNVGLVRFQGTAQNPLQVEHQLRYFDISTQTPVLREVSGPSGSYLEWSLEPGEFAMTAASGRTTHTVSLQRPTEEEV